MSSSNPFEYVAYCHKSSTGNSIKIVAVKKIEVGDQLFVSVKEHERAMKEKSFVAKIYRLNRDIPEQKPLMREAEPSKLNFNLNLWGDLP